MTTHKPSPLVPRLRFPNFCYAGQWEPRRLGQIGEFVGGGTPDTSVPEYWDGNIQWFTPTDVKDRNPPKSKRTISNEGLNNSSAKLLPIGALLISTRASIGNIGIAENPCATNQGFQSLIVSESEVNTFWYYWLVRHGIELTNRASGSTFLEIGKTELNQIPVLRPNEEEQRMIADCLGSLDDLIVAESRKLEALRQHKQGLMQQLFPQPGETVPRLRFPEFQCAGEWKRDQIARIASISKGKGISKADISKNGEHGLIACIRYAELYTHYGEVIREVLSHTNIPPENLVLSQSEDIIIPASGETRVDIARAACVVPAGVGLGSDLNILRSDLNGRFFSYLLNSPIRFTIARLAQGDTVAHLYPGQLSKVTINYPNAVEQKKIADCLGSLDDLIAAKGRKLEALQQHKQGLMQQLFPNLEEK